MRRTMIATALATTLVLGACGDDAVDEEGAATTATPTSESTADVAATSGGEAAGGDAAECADGDTMTEGVFTIATGDPAFPPYVIDDDPASGEGFEAAIGMAVARELGFDADAVTWVRTAFDAAIAPGPKDFDVNLQQYTITPERAEVVDFSDGYYKAAQAIFGLADSPAADAATLEDLRALKIGVAAGTTSVDYVENTISPSQDPLIFNDNASAKQALESDQVDAIVSDLPTALYITAVEIEGTTVYGQIEGSGTDEFGMLLAKDSPITACVDLALAAMRDSGELDDITQEWMSDYTEAPEISL